MSISSLVSSGLNKAESIIKFAYNNTTYYGGRSWSFVKNSVFKPIPTAMQKHVVVGWGVIAAVNLVTMGIFDSLAEKVQKQKNGLRKDVAIFSAGLLAANYALQWATGYPVSKVIPVTIALAGVAFRAFAHLRPDDESYIILVAKEKKLNADLICANDVILELNAKLKEAQIEINKRGESINNLNTELEDTKNKIENHQMHENTISEGH